MTSRTALPANPFRPPERALPANTRLDEFEIERVLAQSSFAVVYRAYDHALKLHVAVKEYLPGVRALRSPETQVVLRARGHAERFEQGLQAFIGEAQTLARCEHPSLLRIARVLQRHGTAYRVMRYSPGPTLLAHRRELAAAPDAQAMRGWLDGLLGALEALHEEGCVHGAVAPGNILLLHGGKPLLMDFDAVRTALISDRTQSMMAALEPCFGPPEQNSAAAESAMGPWSDLYALAATLHFCISGQLPAPPGTAARPFEPLGPVWQRQQPAVPAPPWLSMLDACLAERAADRPASVAEVRALLEAQPRRAPAPRAAPRPLTMVAPVETTPAQSQPQPQPQPQPSAPPVEAAVIQPRPAAMPAAAPPVVAAAVDPAHARVIADLDQTFAFIAAQANEDAAKPPAAGPADAAVEPEPALAGAAPPGQRRLLLFGAVLLLMLLLLGAAAVWMLKVYDPGLFGGTQLGDAAASPWQAAPPVPATPLAYPPPSAGRGDGSVAAVEPPPAARPPAPVKAAPPPPTSPRQACGGRERYALLKCMETQCAKKAWAQHEQCVRLRQERKL
jgi:serine/threonine protein kinase